MTVKDPTIHRGKMALVPNEEQKMPRVIFAFPEGNNPPPVVSGTITRDVEGVAGDEKPEPYQIDYRGDSPVYTGPPYGAPDTEEGKRVIRFDLPAAQNTKGKFTVDESVLRDLPPDLADVYKTPAEYAVTFLEQRSQAEGSTVFADYGLTLQWENQSNDIAYLGVILGYQLRQGAAGEVLKLGALDGPTIEPVFPFYFYIVAATPSRPDPEDLENHRGETAWSPAKLTIDLEQFKKVYPGYPFGKEPSTWSFYHHPLRKDHHPDHRFIVNLAPNGQWNDNNSRSVFTLTVPTAGTQPGLLLGRYFLGIEQG